MSKNLITYKDLKKLEIGQKIEINTLPFICTNNSDKITSTKIKSDRFSQNFRVEMKKGCSIGMHLHDCEEIIVLYQGKLKEMETGIYIKRLAPYQIESFNEHSIIAEEDSMFYVEFKRPK